MYLSASAVAVSTWGAITSARPLCTSIRANSNHFEQCDYREITCPPSNHVVSGDPEGYFTCLFHLFEIVYNLIGLSWNVVAIDVIVSKYGILNLVIVTKITYY